MSAHPGPVPGAGVERDWQVCKLVDTTTCIGCKACEVACLEWNDYAFRETTSRTLTRQCRRRLELLEPD